jgi:hypothetical protein
LSNNEGIKDRRSEDDEKSKEEDVDCFFEVAPTGKADDGDQENERAEKEEESMGKFKKEKEKRVFAKESESILHCQASNDESQEGHNERAKGEGSAFNTVDEAKEEVFHRAILAQVGEDRENVISMIE